jgi:y4mF family transcriptional regulator
MNIQDAKQFGTAVRTRRKAMKITQKDLALTCGTGLRFIIDLEKGKPTTQLEKALRVLQALGLRLQATSLGGVADSKHEP